MDDTPSQTEQDLAGSLRLTAQELAATNRTLAMVRQHLQLRVTDLQERRRRQLDDAAASVERGLYLAGAKYLREAADVDSTCAELQRVLGLLPAPSAPEPDPHHRPHSRACGWREHPHGPACHTNCPTCGGRA